MRAAHSVRPFADTSRPAIIAVLPRKADTAPMNRFSCMVLMALAVPGFGADAQRFAVAVDTSSVRIEMNIEYAQSDTTRLRMDVYSPKSGPRTGRPAFIIFNRATGAMRSAFFPASWARFAAARGLVAILPDLRDGREAPDFRLLVNNVVTRAAELGIDPNAIAVYAGSGNVSAAFPAVEDPAMTAVRTAVMYYGSAQISAFRLDLPVLLVRAGLDRPALNNEMVAIAALAITQNAPVTMLNHPTGYHAFEIANDDDATRDAMEQTVAFVKRTVAPGYQSALRAGRAEASAAGLVLSGKFAEAASIYRDMLAARPDDSRLRLAYGEALLGASQFAAACDEFDKLKGKGLGARDLGLPAARACVQKGDAETAVNWLKSIPARFLPTAVRDEPVFASIRSRPDFVALFAGR
jgi:hypothetical protein